MIGHGVGFVNGERATQAGKAKFMLKGCMQSQRSSKRVLFLLNRCEVSVLITTSSPVLHSESLELVHPAIQRLLLTMELILLCSSDMWNTKRRVDIGSISPSSTTSSDLLAFEWPM